jgi:hypothetical protein
MNRPQYLFKIPSIIFCLIQAIVANKRIEDFLYSEELEEDSITPDPDQGKTSIRIFPTNGPLNHLKSPLCRHMLYVPPLVTEVAIRP